MQNSKITCKLSFFINNSFSILVSSSVKDSLALFSSKLYHFLNLTSFLKSLGVSISSCKIGMAISLILIGLLWWDHGGYWMTFSDYLSSPYFLSFLQRACIYWNYNQKTHKIKAKRYIMRTFFMSFLWLFLCKNNIAIVLNSNNNHWLYNKKLLHLEQKNYVQQNSFLLFPGHTTKLLHFQPHWQFSYGHVSFLANK